MKHLIFVCLIVCTLFFTSNCTNKDVKLVTNVELEFSQENTPEGIVQELLPTTFIITPEAFLPEFEYTFKYEVTGGEGAFLNANGEELPINETIILERTSEEDINFTLNLSYQAKNAGVHKVKVTVGDNFEKSISQTLTYTIEDIPVTWELTSPLTQADEQQEIPLLLTLLQKTDDPSITYEVRYTIPEGSGQLSDATSNITLNRRIPITEGTQNLTLVANQIGTNTLKAELLDSNGQLIPITISFTILELDREPPVITLVGADPLVLLTGTTYTDPGVTLSDNRDTSELLQENLIIDTSAVDTSVPGDYVVTYSVTDSSDNTQMATRTVRINANTTDVPFFAVKGNASSTTEAFTTEIELGAVYELGSVDGLTDNGNIIDQGIEDTNGIGGTIPSAGTYTVRYFATDNDGNTTDMIETIIVMDTTPPTFRINGRSNDFSTPLAAGTVYNARIFESITDASTTDGGQVLDPGNIIGTNLTTGTYMVTYTVTDAVGLEKSITETLTVTDGQAPTFEVRNTNVSPPRLETSNFQTTLEFGTMYEQGMIQNIQDNNGSATTMQEIIDMDNISNSIPPIRSIPYTVIYRVSDQDGNQNEITEEITVSDTTDPTFSVEQNGQSFSSDFTTNLDFGNAYTVGSIINASDLSGTTETITGNDAVNVNAEGSYEVRYTVIDQSPNANSRSILETVLIGPDNQTPIAMNDVGLSLLEGTTLDISVLENDEDPDTGDIISINGVTQPASGGSVTINGSQIRFSANNQVGPTSFTYTIQDQNGAISTPATVEVNVTKIPLSVELTANPTTGVAPIDVNFTATVSNADGTITYSWSIGGSATSNTNFKRYTDVETETVTVTVSAGGETASDSITIRARCQNVQCTGGLIYCPFDCQCYTTTEIGTQCTGN